MGQIIILVIIFSTVAVRSVLAQTTTTLEHKSFSSDELGVDITLESKQEIEVSPKKPLIIKSPNKKEIFKIYVFTKIWENANLKAFIMSDLDPFKPYLLVTDKEQVELDKLQLLGSYGQGRQDYEPIEEVEIKGNKEILLTAKLYSWTLDSNGERIKSTEKVEIIINKYQIDSKGKIVKY